MRPSNAVAALSARSLLRLPPTLHTHIHHNRRPQSLRLAQTRCLSTSEEHIFHTVGDGFINILWGMFELLHSCGLSWAIAIPAGAVAVRSLIIMPWLQIPARKAQQQSAALIPLNYAYAVAIKHKCHLIYYSQGPRVARDKANSAVAKYNFQLRKRWRTERWRQMLPIAGLPVFLGAAEVIRRMTGCRSGLWGIVFGVRSSSPESPGAGVSPGTAQAADDPPDALDAVAEWKGTTSLPNSVPDSAVVTDWIEPSFATEGALWFSNLMLPDPQMILPFLVSGITMATLYRGSKPPSEGKERPLGSILRRVLMMGALAIGPMTLNMPAGILLYWTASTSCAFLSHIYLDKYYPLRMPPKPCKRSVMYNPKGATKANR